MTGPGKGGQSSKKSRINSYILRDSFSSQGIKATAQARSTLDSEQTITPNSSRSRHFRKFNLVDEDMPLVNNEESVNPEASLSHSSGQSSSASISKRGPTRNIALCKKRSANESMSIVLDVEAKRIVGIDSQFFISESGCVVRKFGWHNVSKWSKMDEKDRENIYNAAMARFGVDDSIMIKSAVNKQLNAQYRTHRYKLHKYFQTFQSKEEALRHPPADVPEEDWNWLCEYLTSNSFKKMSERNKKNRAHNDNKTFCGTKSLARVAEEKQRIEGIEVSLIDLYQYGHFSRKIGAWGSEKAKETLEAMREMEETTSMTPREICIMKVGNIPGYRGHMSTSKQIEYDVQRYKQRADKAEKKACEAEKKADEAEKKACDAEMKANELAKKADEAEKRSSQMNDEIIMLREKQASLEHRLEFMMNMFTQLAAQHGN